MRTGSCMAHEKGRLDYMSSFFDKVREIPDGNNINRRKRKTLRSTAGISAAVVLAAGLLLSGCGKSEDMQTPVGSEAESVTDNTEENKAGGGIQQGQSLSGAGNAAGSGETGDVQNTEDTSEEAVNHPVRPLIEEYTNGNYAKKTDADLYIGYTAKCDNVVLSQEDAERYPELAAALEASKQERLGKISEMYEFLKENAEEIVEYREESEQSYETYLDVNYSDGVVRADSKVLSIRTSYTDYAGGAHGYYYDFGSAYDVASGKKLTLGDIVASEDAFRQAVTEKLEDTFKNEYQTELNKEELNANLDGLFGRGKYADPDYGAPGWVLGVNGITVFFPPYSLGAYALGQQEVFISFEEYPDVLNKEYQFKSDSFIVPLVKWSDNYYDLDGDGTIDRLAIDVIPASYDEGNIDTLTKMIIRINGTETELETYTYDGYSLYLAVNEGKSSLYFITQEENDYSILEVYDLSGSAPKEAGEYHGYEGMLGYEYHEPFGEQENAEGFMEGVSVSKNAALTDPHHMILTSRLDMLGTYEGWRICQADKNGVPQSRELYNAVTYYPLTALRDIELENTDIEGSETGEPVTVKEGTKLTICRTDGERIVILTDGSSFYRATIDASDWPRKVNGIPEDEAFDGLFYAG